VATQAAPSYLRAQLPLPLARLNECLDKVNETVNDKRFGDGDDFVTQEELVAKLGLGGKTKTFLLLLQHCGRLKADLAAKAENGNVRYSVCI
jgi:hypothetical protein